MLSLKISAENWKRYFKKDTVNIKKNQTDILKQKNTTTEIRPSMNGFNSKSDMAEERMCDRRNYLV